MAGRLSGEDCMIAILQFTDEQRPGYLETYLNQRDISFRVFRPDSGEALPLLSECSAVALMGGTMEVNDPLPWISDVLSLIREADQRSIPVIGHCLGGQLIARAFGAVVEDNEHYEIGWHQVDISASAQKKLLFQRCHFFYTISLALSDVCITGRRRVITVQSVLPAPGFSIASQFGISVSYRDN